MPALVPVAINDGIANVTFSPDSASATHAVLQDLGEAVLAKRALLHYDRPQNEKSQVRRSVRINVPYTETDELGKTVVKMASFKGEFVSPPTAPKAVRTRVRTLAANAMTATPTSSTVDNPEWFW